MALWIVAGMAGSAVVGFTIGTVLGARRRDRLEAEARQLREAARRYKPRHR